MLNSDDSSDGESSEESTSGNVPVKKHTGENAVVKPF